MSDVQDAIETAVGGKAVSQVLQGEQRYDLVVRYQAPYRGTQRSDREDSPARAFRRARFAGAALQGPGSRRRFGNLSRRQFALCRDQVQRAGRDLGSTVEEAMRKVNRAGEAAARLSHRLGRRVREPEAIASAGSMIVLPLTHPGDLHDPVHDVQLVQVGRC